MNYDYYYDYYYYCYYLQASVNYITKCKILYAKGHKEWVHYNEMTERFEFLHLTRSTKAKFVKSWAIVSSRPVQTKDESGKQDDKGKLKNDSGKQDDEGKLDDKVKQDDSGKPKKSKRNDSGKQDDENKADKKPKKSLDVLLAKAWRTKTRYYNATGAACAFKAQAASDESPHIT